MKSFFVRSKEVILLLSTCIVVFLISSCKKSGGSGGTVIVPPTPNPFDTTGTGPLKNGAAFNVGLAIDYSQYKNDANYAALVDREANNVTFGYQMKHGAIVKNDGSFDFSKTDEMVNQANAAGLWIYGHTLTWHQNNNGDYLRSLATIAGSTDYFSGQNGDFESGTATSFSPYWARLANAPAAANYEVETTSPEQGSRSFKVTVTALGTNPYDVQMIQNNAPTNYWPGVMGTQYIIKLWAKTSTQEEVSGSSTKLVQAVHLLLIMIFTQHQHGLNIRSLLLVQNPTQLLSFGLIILELIG